MQKKHENESIEQNNTSEKNPRQNLDCEGNTLNTANNASQPPQKEVMDEWSVWGLFVLFLVCLIVFDLLHFCRLAVWAHHAHTQREYFGGMEAFRSDMICKGLQRLTAWKYGKTRFPQHKHVK